MRSFFLFFVVASSFLSWVTQANNEVSEPKFDRAAHRARQRELRELIQHRGLLSADISAACYGISTSSFTTTGGTSDFYVVLYPACTQGATYSCTLTCDNTDGVAFLGCTSQTVSSDSNSASSDEAVIARSGSADITDFDGSVITTSGGCGSGITVNFTATVTGGLYVGSYCTSSSGGGCTNGVITCTEDCSTVTIRRFRAAVDRVTGILRYGINNGLRRRKLAEEAEEKHSKYVRGSNKM